MKHDFDIGAFGWLAGSVVFGLVQLVLIVLRATETIMIPWLLAFAPLITAGSVFCALLLAIVIIIIKGFHSKF